MHSLQHTNLALLTTAELVEQLEAMAPGARALLDSLGAGYRSRGEDPAAQGDPLPRFEAGPCPFERGEWAADLTLECGSLVVPESRKQPTGRTLRLAVVILRAPAPAPLPPLVHCNDEYGRRSIAIEDSILTTVSPPGAEPRPDSVGAFMRALDDSVRRRAAAHADRRPDSRADAGR